MIRIRGSNTVGGGEVVAIQMIRMILITIIQMTIIPLSSLKTQWGKRVTSAGTKLPNDPLIPDPFD
jgi:hypothetical protein